ncbi:MAG: transglutaminase family protein [Saprospiraceae bacterium]|nr:transglutaminase family protein [Saprospiraceae bacterium]
MFCNQCSYGGFKASATDWKGYGELIVELNEGRDVLSPAFVNELTEMTKNETETGKVKMIYEYLQNNTRYISVQVGVGGIQPIPANEVYANGYGDCKGLSNLMKAMLSSIGIKSNYVLVEAGENPDGVDNSFIYDPFNHAILCVPFQHDTTWLECTSRFDPCGYQGGFTGNRKALVIEKGNSHLVSTNSYDHNDNTATASLMAKLEEGGDLQVDISMICRNESQDLLRQLQHEADPSIKERYWQSAFSLPSYVVNRVVINAHKEQAVADVDLKLTVSKAVSVSGTRMFMTPVFTNTVHERLLKDGGKTLSLSNEFGSFEMRTEVNNGTLTIVRKRIQYRGNFDKTKYNDFVKYNNDMYQAERTKLVWVKNLASPILKQQDSISKPVPQSRSKLVVLLPNLCFGCPKQSHVNWQ